MVGVGEEHRVDRLQGIGVERYAPPQVRDGIAEQRVGERRTPSTEIRTVDARSTDSPLSARLRQVGPSTTRILGARQGIVGRLVDDELVRTAVDTSHRRLRASQRPLSPEQDARGGPVRAPIDERSRTSMTPPGATVAPHKQVIVGRSRRPGRRQLRDRECRERRLGHRSPRAAPRPQPAHPPSRTATGRAAVTGRSALGSPAEDDNGPEPATPPRR